MTHSLFKIKVSGKMELYRYKHTLNSSEINWKENEKLKLARAIQMACLHRDRSMDTLN